MGVLGPAPGAARAPSCARLGGMAAGPRPAVAGRIDPGALAVEIGPDSSERLSHRVVAAFLGLDPALLTDDALTAPGETTAFFVEPSTPRISAPERIVGVRAAQSDELLSAGLADLAIVSGAAPTEALAAGRARLIGFDALAFVAHPEASQEPLTATDLAGLLSGKLSDWSMVDPKLTGQTILFLPGDGAPSLRAILEFASSRRAKPATVRRIASASDRAIAARATPGALALTLWSALGGVDPIPIGGSAGAVAPTLDTIRSGSYPLIWPVYAIVPEDPAHPSAPALLEYLSSPAGQRMIYDAGLAPVAACDPSTCNLTAPGLDDARARLSARPPVAPLTMSAPAAVAGTPLTSFEAPADFAAPAEPFVMELARFIASPQSGGDLAGIPLQLVARAGPAEGMDPEAAAARASHAIVRTEAAALALRCAGLKVERIIVDPTPLSGAFGDGGLSIELLPL